MIKLKIKGHYFELNDDEFDQLSLEVDQINHREIATELVSEEMRRRYRDLPPMLRDVVCQGVISEVIEMLNEIDETLFPQFKEVVKGLVKSRVNMIKGKNGVVS